MSSFSFRLYDLLTFFLGDCQCHCRSISIVVPVFYLRTTDDLCGCPTLVLTLSSSSSNTHFNKRRNRLFPKGTERESKRQSVSDGEEWETEIERRSLRTFFIQAQVSRKPLSYVYVARCLSVSERVSVAIARQWKAFLSVSLPTSRQLDLWSTLIMFRSRLLEPLPSIDDTRGMAINQLALAQGVQHTYFVHIFVRFSCLSC